MFEEAANYDLVETRPGYQWKKECIFTDLAIDVSAIAISFATSSLIY